VNNSSLSGIPIISTTTLRQWHLAEHNLTHYFFKTLHNIIFKNENANLLLYWTNANSFTVGVRFNTSYQIMVAQSLPAYQKTTDSSGVVAN
jgi:hypothetical protein